MLMRFTAENILCFKEEASISLVASSDDRHQDHVYNPISKKRPKILRASAVYGANGHGKTKLVEAIDTLRLLVINDVSEDNELAFSNFKLDSKSNNKPSKLVIEFRIGNEDYEYGLSFYKTHICEEWLFSTDKNDKEELIFERVTTIKEDGSHDNKVVFGKKIKSHSSPSKNISMSIFLDVLGAGLRKNQPLLKETVDRNISALKHVYDWFREVLSPVHADASYRSLHRRAKKEQDFVDLMSNFISNSDIGIQYMKYQETPLDENVISIMPAGMIDRVKEGLDRGKSVEIGTRDGSMLIFNKNKEDKIIVSRILAVRKNDEGKEITFEMTEESSGTRRLLDMIPMLNTGKQNKIYVVDELDRKLHPILAEKFIETFLKKTNSQIIYTTHNTYLLDLDLLRRDEIWFIQKRENGSSEIYSLSDLKIRPDLDVRKGYLNGRFGAIPFTGNIMDLGWGDQENGSNAASTQLKRKPKKPISNVLD